MLLVAAFAFPSASYGEEGDGGFMSDEERARVSFAFGMAIGFNLLEADMAFDYDAFVSGMRSVLENTPGILSEEEAFELVNAAFQAAMLRMLERNRQDELDFLAANRERPEINETESGLQYEVLRQGYGERPGYGSVVRVHYEGFLLDGTLFDSTRIDNESAVFNLSAAIPGWSEGIMLMNEGAIYRLYVPSNLAYGRGGIPQLIPPYSTLVFTVELLEIIAR